MNLAISINKAVIDELTTLATTRGKTIEQMATEIISDYLEEAQDYADAQDALAALDRGEEEVVPWEQVKKELGLGL